MNSAPEKDFYAVLGVHPHAEDIVIKAAYRAMSKQYHPDKGLGSTRHMQAINEAYQVLSDPQLRSAYDASWAGLYGKKKRQGSQTQQQQPNRPKQPEAEQPNTKSASTDATAATKLPPVVLPSWLAWLYVFAQASTSGLLVAGTLFLAIIDTAPFLHALRFAFPLGLAALALTFIFLIVGPEGPGFGALFSRGVLSPQQARTLLGGRELLVHAAVLLALLACIICRIIALLLGQDPIPTAIIHATTRTAAGIGGLAPLVSIGCHYLTGQTHWPQRVRMFSVDCAFYPPTNTTLFLLYALFFFGGL